jgi:hypothetical protein
MAAMAAAAIVLPGCEDSPLTAGKDFTMTIIAQPGTVLINPPEGIDHAQATILATVLNANAVPQQGITVYFSNNGGTLASGKNGVKTNSGGVASDTLTVTSSDPVANVVTATSAALSESVTVTKSSVVSNRPPVALIVASPAATAAAGQAVVFDGSGSSDPDTGDFITMYKWVITSTNPDVAGTGGIPPAKPNPIIAEGPAVSGISIPNDTMSAFRNAQDLTVTLLVTDDPTAPAEFAAGNLVAYRAQQTIQYTITGCANTKPTAVIAGGATQQIFGGAGTNAAYGADGSLSTDAETGLSTYTWSCGNGSLPQTANQAPGHAVCNYLVDGVPRTYTITLVVTDKGTGTIDPNTGTFACAAQSTPATIQLTVSPLAGG